MTYIRCLKCGIDDRKDFRIFFQTGDEEYFEGDPCPRCRAPLELVEEADDPAGFRPAGARACGV